MKLEPEAVLDGVVMWMHTIYKGAKMARKIEKPNLEACSNSFRRRDLYTFEVAGSHLEVVDVPMQIWKQFWMES